MQGWGPSQDGEEVVVDLKAELLRVRDYSEIFGIVGRLENKKGGCKFYKSE